MNRVLDIATWRCGRDGPHKLGEGHTRMTNKEGYSCCLGQFANETFKHLYPDAKYNYIDTFDEPQDIAEDLTLRYDPLFVNEWLANTKLTCNLMGINDDRTTTPLQKIESIRLQLAKAGDTLEVLNLHLLEK